MNNRTDRTTADIRRFRSMTAANLLTIDAFMELWEDEDLKSWYENQRRLSARNANLKLRGNARDLLRDAVRKHPGTIGLLKQLDRHEPLGNARARYVNDLTVPQLLEFAATLGINVDAVIGGAEQLVPPGGSRSILRKDRNR